MSIIIDGLPGGWPAAITVAGPGGSRVVNATTTLSGLAPGTYTVTATSVDVSGNLYAPTPPLQSLTVTAGETRVASPVVFTLSTGSLVVSIGGLPGGAPAAVVISGPGGFGRSVTDPVSIAGLVPGDYVIEARRVRSGDYSYDALVPAMTVAVAAVPSATVASITYAIATGALQVTVQGLPAGTAAAVRVAGPNGYQGAITASATLANLEPGTYTVTGDPVVVGPDTWGASPTANVTVSASSQPASTTTTYAIATGRLTVTATGHPEGTNPILQVTGPGSFTASITSGTTLTGLAPGTYTVSAPSVGTGTATWSPAPPTQQVAVGASQTPAAAAVTYALASGSLSVTVTGLPQVVQASLTVTGPNGFQASLSGSATLTNLAPGQYAVSAANVASGVHIYSATPAVQSIAVAASLVPATAQTTYALASGLISITVSGLPGGTAAAITVSGPGGYQVAVTGTTILTGLTPGAYQVAAAAVGTGPVWVPTPASQGVIVTASTVAVPAAVTYSQATGLLTVNVTGLPGGVPASVTVTGPGGYNTALTTSQTLTVPVGTYTITASTVSQSGTVYTPAPTSQAAPVALGETTVRQVAYTGSLPSGLNLFIDGAYITQSVQTYGNAVPLVAGRNGLLRVFVRATATNSAQPAVRVRFYNGPVLLNTITIPAPSASVPQAVTEGTLNSSWNAALAGSLLQPGISMLLDVDPGDTVAESDEGDNAWPASGTPQALNVRALSALGVRFVPVTQSANGLTGNVSEGNKATWLSPMARMFPAAAIDADIHATYTTSVPALQSGGGNWSSLLSEINALRVAEGSSRNYYGVVKVSYTSGVAGLGYIGVPAAIGWDHLPSGSEVMAHELGHNFARYHAPCGGPAGVDSLYPYSGGVIGAYGYDIVAGTLKPPTQFDLMSYCDPSWISDYNYTAILNYREAHPDQSGARVSGAAAGRALLVWGRIDGGRLVLEPAFEVDAPAALPARAGPNRIEGLGAAGEVLFSFPFAGEPVADAPHPDDQTFAFAIPLSVLPGGALARLRLSALGQSAELGEGPVATGDYPAATRTAGGKVRVSWKGGVRAALVRNARTGQVLSISRGSAVEVLAGSDELDVVLSDGVRSQRSRVNPP